MKIKLKEAIKIAKKKQRIKTNWQKYEKPKIIIFYDTLTNQVRLCERFHIYERDVLFTSYFQATNGKNLYEIYV